MTDRRKHRRSILLLVCLTFFQPAQSQRRQGDTLLKKIDYEVIRGMEAGKIPGLSLVIIDSGREIVKSYGYADTRSKKPVTAQTLFQLGSCSKAFTALAIQELADAGTIDLDTAVSSYIPWFHPVYKGAPVTITLLQLLHHTSGISWQTIGAIPRTDATDALEQTVRMVADVQLKHKPGKVYEYATLNYDILALVIQRMTYQPFEAYLQEHVFRRLMLSHTTIGYPRDSSLIATGYKIGFFEPRKYAGPVFRGNNAAGYVISDATDMSRWLKLQMGLVDSDVKRFIDATHQRDETVALHDMDSYAQGWEVSLDGSGEISHFGLNPNFTAYIAFRNSRRTGVVLLANCNSRFTADLGNRLMKILAGEKPGKEYDTGNGDDRAYSTGSGILALYILGILFLLFLMLSDILNRRRIFSGISLTFLRRIGLTLITVSPFLYGLYLLPAAMAGFSWASILVWSPVSFEVLVILIVAAVGISCLIYFLSLLFPSERAAVDGIPRILLLSVLSGLANMIIIVLVTSALDSSIRVRYLAFYFCLALALYLLGRRFVQINLIKLSRGAIYQLRIKLIDKILAGSYQHFEKIDRGRIFTSLNDDVETLGSSADQLIMLITNVFTVLGAFLYLISLAFWTALLTILMILAIATIYFLVSKSTRIYFEEARNTQNTFIRLVNGMIDGFKEISLQWKKKAEYRSDIENTAGEYRIKISKAGIRFVNAFLVGESLLVFLLGVIVFGIPRAFPGIQTTTLLSFVIVLLYLIGPINGILGAVPSIMQIRVAWDRIQNFIKDIPAAADTKANAIQTVKKVNHIRLENIRFQYRADNEQENFVVGPINMELKSGEALFIIGGNGSGKTTLAKLLTGLYKPDSGQILINNEVMTGPQLSEHFSTVFNPPYLFDRLYNIDVKAKIDELQKYLQILDLDEKVSVIGDRYTTINLSSGQRKRLALLQCYLEDSPIYLFDEWAADQDPSYRNFFYRELLPEMKRKGKIVIAITHDDHYFGLADKVLTLKYGLVESYVHTGSFLASSKLHL
jgi:cyclic peptide transporter